MVPTHSRAPLPPVDPGDETELDLETAEEDASPEEAAVGAVVDGDIPDEEAAVAEEITADEDGPAVVLPELDAKALADVKKAMVPPDVLDESADIPKAKTQQVPPRWIKEPLRPEDLFDHGSI